MASYQLVLEKFDGYVQTQRVIIHLGTLNACAERCAQLEDTVEFLDEHNYSEDYQRWEAKVPAANGEFPWVDFQVRHIKFGGR